jgi:Tfp pilus assembly major pilin PilA
MHMQVDIKFTILVVLATFTVVVINTAMGGMSLSRSTKLAEDISIMATNKPMFPVYADIADLANTVAAAQDRATPHPLAPPSSRNRQANLFGTTFDYVALGTVDQDEIEKYFAHISVSGDGSAECKTNQERFSWTYAVNLPTNGYDPESKVYFGTGFDGGSIPYVQGEVVIADCNDSHPGVCIVGDTNAIVLPWKSDVPSSSSDTMENDRNLNSIHLIDNKHGGLGRRRLVTASFWELDEVAVCWTDEYDLLLYTNGHQVIVAAPSDPASQCPIIAIDAGYAVHPQTENKDDEEFQAVSSAPEVDIKTLAKYITVVRRDEFDSFDTLDLRYKMPLRKFYLAVENARTSVKTEKDYDIISNNCAVFILDVLAYLKLPYKETKMKSSLVNYVADGLIENEEVKNKILDSVSKQGTTAGVWRHLRSDKAIMKHVAGSFIEKHHLD